MDKSYSASRKKVLFISATVLVVLCLVFAFSRGKFEVNGLGLGTIFGFLFALLLIIYGFGQKVELSKKEISYSSNSLALFINKFKKRLQLSEIIEIRLGIPKFNKNNATFAAVNIATTNEEISFNPDLFDNTTLRNLFRELRNQSPNIKLDDYTLNLIEGKDDRVFQKMVLGNLLWTTLLIILIGIISLLFYKMEIISKEAVFVINCSQIIIVPIIFNWFANIFNK
jgi:hypothetical protein